MKKLALVVILAVFCVVAISSFLYAEGTKGMMSDKMGSQMCCSKSEVNLRLAMRKLWEDHIIYTRNYIISALADLEDEGAVAQRLLSNQDDIGKAIKTYYGNTAGDKLAALLREHIVIATEVVKVAKMGDAEELAKAQTKWNANADDIAVFLSGANPNWAKKGLTDMLYKHLELTTGEVVSRLHKDWIADISFYDNGHTHMLMFADVLTDGIIKQFPDKFKNIN